MSDQSLAQRSPRSRKSLSSGVSFGNQENQALVPSLSAGKKGKGRAASIGGAELMGARGKPLLSPKKAARRAAAPRKSILKQYNQDDTTMFGNSASAEHDDDDNDTQFLGRGGESTTMFMRRRVSFAAHAHVRMFETEPASNSLSQSQSSASSRQQQQQQQAALPKATATANIFGGAPPVAEASAAPPSSRRRSSAGGHSRRASVQGVEAFSKPAAAVGFAPTPSFNSRRSSAASEGSVDMDIESDEEEANQGQYNFQLDPPTPGSGSPAVFEGASTTPFSFGNGAPPAIVIQGEDEQDDASDDGDMSLEGMDETQVHGGILAPAPAAKRQSLTHPTSPSASTEDGDSDEDDGGLELDQEDKTMDFTVATGGIIPTSAPATASYVRGSVGYAIEKAEAERMAAWSKPEPGSLAARRAAAAAEEEMRWDGDEEEEEENDGSEMDMTRVIGGIIRESDEAAEAEEGEEGSTMDFTRVAGGIIAQEDEEAMDEESDISGEMDMDETVAVGGLIMPRNDDDNHTTRRSIFDNDDTGAMDFTIAHGGLLAPAPPQEPIASPKQPLFGRSSLNLSSKSPAKSPRKSLGAFVPPTPTRPLESSLTRPTASSAAKIKPAPTPRTNIFDSPAKALAPIPSRGKPSAATPGSARKLSFGAVASPGKKRAAEEMEQDSSSIFTTALTAKSPKRRASAANAVQAQPVEVDVFGAVAGSGGAKSKGREAPAVSPAPATSLSNIFGTYVVEESIATAPEQPPSPVKKAPAVAALAPPGSPARSIFTKAASPSPSKGPATIFDLPSSSSAPASEANSFEQATSIFSTSPKIAPPAPVAHRPRSSLAFAEPLVPAVASSSSSPTKNVAPTSTSFAEEKSFSKAATPKKKLGRPSISRRERESVDDEVMADEAHQPAPIALGQFLDMTGLTFMDKIHPRRRSTIGPGEMLGLHRNQGGDNTTRSASGREYQTIEYANYVLSFPYLAIYQWACSHLKESTIQSQQTVQVLDHNASESNPLLFREYLEAEDEEKGMIEAQLKYLKVYSHLLIKRRWREWRLDLIVKLKSTHQTDLADLEEDRIKIQALTTQLEKEQPLGTLRTKHAEIKAQLERERAKVEEVLACDQNELKHRMNDTKEQKDQIDSLRADLKDHTVMLQSLTTKRDALEAQRAAAQEAIDRASSSYADTQGFTRERMFRLKDEYETIGQLHGVEIVSLRSDEMELVCGGVLRLVMRCEKFKPGTEDAVVSFVSPPGGKARRNEVALGHLASLVASFKLNSKTVPQLVSTVAHLANSIHALSTELHLIALRYPLSYATSSSTNSLDVTVPLLLPKLKSRVLLKYSITAQTLLSFPAGWEKIQCEVVRGYGKVGEKECAEMKKRVAGRVGGASVEGWFGSLVEGCLAGVEPYVV